jgi:deoxyribodipyrimidine photo-lyase
MKISIFWFRRDLRLVDNTGLFHALQSGFKVLPIFIFDANILQGLCDDDPWVNFIYERLQTINEKLKQKGGSLKILKGDPIQVFENLINAYDIAQIYLNKDYEPYSLKRDQQVEDLLRQNGIELFRFKDLVVFEENDIVKKDGKAYTVFTPYKNRWLEAFFTDPALPVKPGDYKNLFQQKFPFPELSELGFRQSSIQVRDFDLSHLGSLCQESRAAC